MRFVRSPLFWIGLVVSLGSLVLAFRGLRWGSVGDALLDANYGLLALTVVLMLVSLVLRGQRWAVLFYPRRGMSLVSLTGALNVGYAFNNLLPLRVGELARAYVIGEAEDVSSAHALSTIVVERTLDTLTVVALLLITIPFIDAPDWVKGPAVLVGLGFLGLAVLLAAVSAAQERAMALVSRAVRFLPERYRQRTVRAAESALEGFAVLRRPAVLVQAVGWSVASWLTSAALVFVTLRAFDLELSFTAALFVMGATSLGMIVPSSPGYIGVYHAIAIETLTSVFGVERADAAGFALVSHALFYLVPIIFAMAYLWSRRESWQEMLSGALSRPEAKRP